MAFEISLSEEALSELRKLENENVKRIIERLEKTGSNPFHFFERLVGREEYKLRIGDYRLLARILPEEKRIFVYSIGHRKNIYKK
jgi:mRNA interferase RelE/StbE